MCKKIRQKTNKLRKSCNRKQSITGICHEHSHLQLPPTIALRLKTSRSNARVTSVSLQ